MLRSWHYITSVCCVRCLGRARVEPDGTRAETTIRLSPKRTNPFTSAGESVQSTAGSRVVGISFSNAGYTTFRGRVRELATHSIRQFPLPFPSRASPFATTFYHSTTFYLNLALDEGKWLASRPDRFTLRLWVISVAIEQKAAWASESDRALGRVN